MKQVFYYAAISLLLKIIIVNTLVTIPAIKYINTAIDANSKKIAEKVKKDPIFIPIIAKISIPFNLEEPNLEEKENKLEEKEVKAKEHLEEMSELTRNLSYNDINLLKRNSTAEGKAKKQEQNKEQKERE